MEAEILLWIQEYIRNPILNSIFSVFSFLGDDGKIFIAILLVMLCFKKTRKPALIIAVLLIAYSLIFTLGVKHIVNRTRPFEAIEGLTTIGSLPSDSSFPSGHTGTAFTFALGMYYACDKKAGIVSIIFAFIMGFSRMYVGVHYPTDVICGAIFGVLTVIVGLKLMSKKISIERIS